MPKKILNVMTALLAVLIVIMAILLAGPKLFGFDTYAVLSGSMEPAYPVGSLIYVKETETSELKVGQAITYKLTENMIVTHRVVEIIPDPKHYDSLQFRTKGDANKEADSVLVNGNDVIGIPVFVIPYLGYLAFYIQHSLGTVVLLIVCVVLGLNMC